MGRAFSQFRKNFVPTRLILSLRLGNVKPCSWRAMGNLCTFPGVRSEMLFSSQVKREFRAEGPFAGSSQQPRNCCQGPVQRAKPAHDSRPSTSLRGSTLAAGLGLVRCSTLPPSGTRCTGIRHWCSHRGFERSTPLRRERFGRGPATG